MKSREKAVLISRATGKNKRWLNIKNIDAVFHSADFSRAKNWIYLESFRAGKIIIYTRKKKMKDKKLYQLDKWLLRKRKQKADL